MLVVVEKTRMRVMSMGIPMGAGATTRPGWWGAINRWTEAHPVTAWYVVGAVFVGFLLALVIDAFKAAF